MNEPVSHKYRHDQLTIEVEESEEWVEVKWLGKSYGRSPGQFITPILSDALLKSGHGTKRLVLDFRKLQYMNSSTITPVIKFLERAKRSTARVAVYYDQSLRWQDLNFSALTIFETPDQRVEIKGL